MNNASEQLNLLKTFSIISAILNLLYAIGWTIYTIFGGIITCGIWCLFGVVPVINIIACIMDFVAYTKLNELNKTGTYGTLQFAAIFDIITLLTGNIASMIFGIVALVFISNPDIRNYLVEKGIY